MSPTNIAEQFVKNAYAVLSNWKSLFASWATGLRPNQNTSYLAAQEQAETILILRAELTACLNLLLHLGVVTKDQFDEKFCEAVILLNQALENKFPGFKSTNEGLVLDKPITAQHTLMQLGIDK